MRRTWGATTTTWFSAIAADAAGNAYVAGTTASTNFPVSLSAYQKVLRGGLNGFLTKINSTGSSIAYSTYYGGKKTDIPGALALDSSGNAYVAGDTTSTDFPTTTGVFQATHRGGTDAKTDVFVMKFNSSGSTAIYATLLGGSGDDVGSAIAVDAAGNAYVAGKTSSSGFPVTAGAFQRDLSGPEDAFVAKLNPGATAVLYCTLLGGTRQERPYGIAVDPAGNAYVGGRTTSSSFPVVAAFQPQLLGDSDGFVAKLDPNGAKVLQSSYLGGSGDDDISGVALDAAGNLYVAGNHRFRQLPGVHYGWAQTKFAGMNADAILARINFAESRSP